MFTYSNGYWEVYRRFQKDFFGLGGYLRGRVTGEDLCLEEIFMGKTRLTMEGAHDFLVLFLKNNEKTNMKSFFY